MNMFLLKLF